jgi:hypothetical protein
MQTCCSRSQAAPTPAGSAEEGSLPELGFDFAKAAELPISHDESVHGNPFDEIGELELEGIGVGQFFELGGVFARDHERLRLNSGF